MCTSKFNAIDHHLYLILRCALSMCCIAFDTILYYNGLPSCYHHVQ